jgi:7-cyano-7-deazaguanine synthase
MKNAIILCSGGIDSVVTAHYARKRFHYKGVIILFFDYGQKSLIQERKCAKKCAASLKAEFKEIKLKKLGKISTSLINTLGKIKEIKLKDLKDSSRESSKWYVPCRNTIFLSYALALAESSYIKEKKVSDLFVGFKCEGKESYPDTTKEFVAQINKLSKISCAHHFKLYAPLIKKDKEDIVQLGQKLGVDFKNTYSCYIGTKKTSILEHCGYCLACRLRQEGFYWADICDPTNYKIKMKDFRKANPPKGLPQNKLE